jgi:hypothetical protein
MVMTMGSTYVSEKVRSDDEMSTMSGVSMGDKDHDEDDDVVTEVPTK